VLHTNRSALRYCVILSGDHTDPLGPEVTVRVIGKFKNADLFANTILRIVIVSATFWNAALSRHDVNLH
jgi:hypothetical protein